MDLKRLDFVVISHRHLDHTSGLSYRFLDRQGLGKLYADAGVSDGIVETPGTIGDNVRRLANLDPLGCRVRLNDLIQPVEQQFRHQITNIVANPLAGHKEIRDRGPRDIGRLAVIGAGWNGSGEIEDQFAVTGFEQ